MLFLFTALTYGAAGEAAAEELLAVTEAPGPALGAALGGAPGMGAGGLGPPWGPGGAPA